MQFEEEGEEQQQLIENERANTNNNSTLERRANKTTTTIQKRKKRKLTITCGQTCNVDRFVIHLYQQEVNVFKILELIFIQLFHCK